MRYVFLAAAVLATMLLAARAEGPGDAIIAAHADAQRLPLGTRQYVRYLSLYNLPAAERESAVKVLAFWVNSLSRSAELVAPVRVSETLLRVNLLDYGWEVKTWDRLADSDVYFHQQVDIFTNEYWPGGNFNGRYFGAGYYREKKRVAASASWLPAREAAELIGWAQSRAPVVRADWWFVQTVRQLSLRNRQDGIGYYDWIGVKNRDDFFKLIKLSEKDSLEIGKEMRAAVLRSGVATQNRQIVRLQALTGGHWTTLDTDDSTGNGNAIERLKRGEFVHKAEEHFGVAPNGLFYFLLCDKQGALQPSAPDFIGPDDSPLRSGRDGRIHPGLSCIRCHVEGLRPINDWVRQTLRTPLGLQSADYKELVELRRQYFSNLEGQLERDRFVFAEALAACNGLKPAENAKVFARFWDRYAENDRGPAEVAVELGVTEPVLIQALKSYVKATGSLPTLMAGLLQNPPVGIRPEHWEALYEQAQEIIRGQIRFGDRK